METRANYVLIGAFTLAGLLAALGLLLWLAKVEVDRQYAYYDVEFASVAGLSPASPVRYTGLPVGQVVDIAISPSGSGLIQVRLEVRADTPVRTSTIATIESQGVTGLSYVGLSRGDSDDPLLIEVSNQPVPDIQAGQSALQSLTQDAPAIAAETLELLEGLSEILSPDNQQRVTAILANLDAATGDLQRALDDVSELTDNIGVASEAIGDFADGLDGITASATRVLDTADVTLQDVSRLTGRVEASLDEVDAALASGRSALAAAEGVVTEDVPRLIETVQTTADTLAADLAALGSRGQEVLDTFDTTGGLANARLAEARATIAAADTALATGTEALGAARTLAEGDIPALVAQIGDAATLVTEQVSAVTGRTTEVLDTFDTTGGLANARLAEARATIAAADTALATGTEALGAARTLAQGDIPALVAQIGDAATLVTEQVSAVTGRTTEVLDTFDTTGGLANARLAEARATIAAADTALATGTEALGAARTLAHDIPALVAQIGDAATLVTEQVSAVTGRTTEVLDTFDTTGGLANARLAEARATIAAADTALATGTEALGAARTLAEGDIPALVGQIGDAATLVTEQVSAVTGRTTEVLDTFDTTGGLANARLAEARATIAAADTALADATQALTAVEAAAADIGTLATGDGAALIAELRLAVARADAVLIAAEAVATEDLPAIVADIREAADTTQRVVAAVGTDLSEATGGIDALTETAVAALDEATATFARANATLDAIDTALGTAETTLETATGAFERADAVLGEDLTDIIAGIEATLGRIDGAVMGVSEDLPLITADLRAAASSAEAALAEVEATAGALSGPLRGFAADGLPQYTRLARESRDLIDAIERLVRSIERDPARFLFGSDSPVFQR